MPSRSANASEDGEAELFPSMDMNLTDSRNADLRPTVRHFKVYRPNHKYRHQDDLFPNGSEPRVHSSPPESLEKLSPEEIEPLRDEIDHAYFGRENNRLPLTIQNPHSSRDRRFTDSIDHTSKPSISTTTMSSGRSPASIRSGKSHTSSLSATNTLTKSNGKLSVKKVQPFETSIVYNDAVLIRPKKANKIISTKREPAFPKRTVVRPGRFANYWFDGPEGQISSDEEDAGSETAFKKSRLGHEFNSTVPSVPDSRKGSTTKTSTYSLPRAPGRHVSPLNCPLPVQCPRQSVENITGQDSNVDSEVAADHLPVLRGQVTRSEAGSKYSTSPSHSRNVKQNLTNPKHEHIVSLSSSEDDVGNELRSSKSSVNDTSRTENSSDTNVIASKQQKKTKRRSSTGSRLEATALRPSFIPVISRRSFASGPPKAPTGRQNESTNAPSSSAIPQKYSANQLPRTTRLREPQEAEVKSTDVRPAKPTTLEDNQDTRQRMRNDGSGEHGVSTNHNGNEVIACSQRIPYEVLLELVRHSKDAVPEKYLREIVKKSRGSVCFDDLVAAAQSDDSRVSVEEEKPATNPAPPQAARRPSTQQTLGDNANSGLRNDRERRRSRSLGLPQSSDIIPREGQSNKTVQKLGPPLFTDHFHYNDIQPKPPRKLSYSSLSRRNTESKQPRRPSTSDQRSKIQHSSSEQDSQSKDVPSRRHLEEAPLASSKRGIFSGTPKSPCQKIKGNHHRSSKKTGDSKLQSSSGKDRSSSVGASCRKPGLSESSKGSAPTDNRSKSFTNTSRSPSRGTESSSRPATNRSGSPHSMVTTSSHNNSLSPATALTSVSQKPPRTPRLRARYKLSPCLLQPPSLAPNTEADDLANSTSPVSTVRDMLLNLPMDKFQAPPSVEPSIISDCYRSESSGTQESIGINEARELTIVTSTGPHTDHMMDDNQACHALRSKHEKRRGSNGNVCH